MTPVSGMFTGGGLSSTPESLALSVQCQPGLAAFVLAYPLAVDNRIGTNGFNDVTGGVIDGYLNHLVDSLVSRSMTNTFFA